MLNIITSNKSKFKSARKRLKEFNIKLHHKDLDLIEPQADNVLTVAEYKSQQAFEILHQPVLVSDVGWSIPALNGFPGPFMHHIINWFDAGDFLNLMRDKKDRRISVENVIVYKDSKTLKAFLSKREGKILKQAKGKGIAIDRIVSFRKDNKSIAECIKSGISRFDTKFKDSVWTRFGEWFNKRVGI